MNCNGANYHVYALGAIKCSLCGKPRFPVKARLQR